MAKRKRRHPKQTAKLDIIIPVYGRPDLLTKCLDSIQATIGDISHQVIIVDDCGPDQEELNEVYTSLNGNTRLSRNKENQGFPATVNRGISLGNALYVLILNSDIELQLGAIQTMIKELDDNPEVGIVGPKLLFPEDSQDPQRPAGKVQHAGVYVNFDAQFLHTGVGWAADHPKLNKRLSIQAVTGACLMTRRNILKEIHRHYQANGDPTKGAFNEVYSPGTYEDIEFCFAARSLGYQVIYQPEAVGYHHVGGSIVPTGKGYPLQRNEMIFRARCGNMLMWDEWRIL